MRKHGEENEFYLLSGFEDRRGAAANASFGPVFAVFNFVKAKASYLYHQHKHPSFEMILPLTGVYRCVLNGEELNFGPGKALLIQPGDIHQDIYAEGMEYAGTIFNMEAPEPEAKTERIFKDGIRPSEQLAEFPCVKQLLAAKCRFASGELKGDDLFAHYIIAGTLQTFFWETLAGMDKRLFAPAFLELPVRDAFRKRLLRHFEENAAGKLSLDAIAEALKVSKSGLSHKCKELLGIPPSKAFLDFKLAKARRLLEDGLSVKETGESLGFANQFHFSRAFKRRFGVAPSSLH